MTHSNPCTARSPLARLLAAAGLVAALAPVGSADEGMWLLNAPPRAQLKEKYGFEPTAEWLTHLQRAAARYGASSSFVSGDGLLMTNHHVGSRAIRDLSTPERNLITNGFYAKTRADELKVPGGEVTVLEEIIDVTDKVTSAAAGKAGAEANTARQKAIAEIEKTEQEQRGLQARIVTLYGGGKYHLYLSKRYTDVRLVFAPEEQIAFFGGDTDNFEYPRFNLDITFFRVYENDQPVHPKDFLKWSPSGVKDGELTFTLGNPGQTQRLLTYDHLRFVRDVETPTILAGLWRNEVKNATFAGRSAEYATFAHQDMRGVTNSRKARTGQYSGLLDPAVMNAKRDEEQRLRSAIARDPALTAQVGDAFEKWSKTLDEWRTWYPRYAALGRGMLSGELAGQALTIARLADELPKPNGERLREYRDSSLPRLYQRLFADTPVHKEYEAYVLAQSITRLAELLGADDPIVVAVLAGKSPQDRAREIIVGTRLNDPSFRKQLAEGGKAAVDAANDPLIALVRIMDPEARVLRKRYEETIEPVERETYAKITPARFAVLGEGTYPDATGTLRISYGKVAGYTQDGKPVAPFTDFAGLYERGKSRAGEADFALPQRWIDRKNKLNLKTPFNFVSTNDIIGGNSGSPLVNQNGELVGIAFDGNIQSLPGAFYYSAAENRTVAVDSRGILEALRAIYEADALAKELSGH